MTSIRKRCENIALAGLGLFAVFNAVAAVRTGTPLSLLVLPVAGMLFGAAGLFVARRAEQKLDHENAAREKEQEEFMKKYKYGNHIHHP